MIKTEDLEALVLKVAAEFNLEFFYTDADVEDQELMIDNLNRSESMTSFAINRFMEYFNELAEQSSNTDDIVIAVDNTVKEEAND